MADSCACSANCKLAGTVKLLVTSPVFDDVGRVDDIVNGEAQLSSLKRPETG